MDIVPVTLEDEGLWVCTAQNYAGKSSTAAHLTLIGAEIANASATGDRATAISSARNGTIYFHVPRRLVVALTQYFIVFRTVSSSVGYYLKSVFEKPSEASVTL